jgi:cell wall-associated NlpC family hydrolase
MKSVLPSAGTIVLALVLSACSASAPRFTSRPAPERSDPPRGPDAAASGRETNPGIDRHAMLSVIMSKMGIPYDYSGADSLGMDCSGLVQTVYREAAGIALPRSSAEQYAAGMPVSGEELQFGDLVFFNTTGKTPSHEGVYVGDGIFAHASVSNGVTVSLLSQEYYRQRYVGARRIVR